VSAWVWIAVAALGALGAAGRFVLDAAIAGRGQSGFPFGTFVINTTGAFALGVLSGLAVGGDLLVLLGGATLGAYTTFSTWMFETHRLAEDGRLRLAAVNAAGGLVAGVGAAALGRLIGVHV
jgi:fluoride exporter